MIIGGNMSSPKGSFEVIPIFDLGTLIDSPISFEGSPLIHSIALEAKGS